MGPCPCCSCSCVFLLFSGHPEKEIIDPLELRVAELMHHMKIESAVAEGAKNVVKHTMNGRMVMDRRILAEVSVLLFIAASHH